MKRRKKGSRKRKRKMAGWFFGVPLVVAALVILILLAEPGRDGVTRAAAFKAAALSVATVEECRLDSRERSEFPAASRDQWYVKYMDALYRRGWIDGEMTPATEEAAEGLLTYEEADFLAGRVSDALKARVGLTDKNKKKPYPPGQWWNLYEALCRELEVWQEEKVREEVFVVYGTFEDVEDGTAWRAYTSLGNRGFEGLGVGAVRDQEIRALVSGSEILRIQEKISRSVTYKNIWIMEAGERQLTAYVGSLARTFPVKSRIKNPQEMALQVADLYVTDGEVKKVVLKKERVSGKVLEVREDEIEIEGYGSLAIGEEFNVYRLYGEFRRQSLSNVVVGSNVHEFAVADGRLCAALTMRPFDAETIRVLVMDSGFQSIFHESVTLEFLSPGVMVTGDREEAFKAGDIVTFRSGDEKLKNARVVIRPTDESAGIRLPTVSRGQGTPAYPGRMEIKQESEGLVLVNEVYLEEYLKRVVPSEMPASYAKEALKAQAVCARTYAWRQIMANSCKSYGAHVDDSTKYQVYNNVETSPATDAAVNETYGKLITYGGQVAEVYYFSTSCGHTTDGTIWGASLQDYPYLRGVAVKEGGGEVDLTDEEAFSQYIKGCPEGFESEFGMYRWTARITGEQVQRKAAGIGEIVDLTVKERLTGGIGKVLLVKGTAGSREIEGEGQIRAVLGSGQVEIRQHNGNVLTGWESLPSAFITIEKEEGEPGEEASFVVYGGGYGHGVGMSQNGAQAMAKEGKSYRQILELFYDGTEVGEIEEVGMKP